MAASVSTNPGYTALATGLMMASRPVPYDSDGNIVVQSDAVYVNGSAMGTP